MTKKRNNNQKKVSASPRKSDDRNKSQEYNNKEKEAEGIYLKFETKANDMKRQENKIIVKNFSFFYGKVQALKNINMNVKGNSVVGIIGPSGCGKSTFLRCFNRMNDTIIGTHHTGLIEIDEKNIYDKHLDVVDLRRSVGMVFQKSNPFPKSIFENVAYGLKINGIKDKNFIAEKIENSLKNAALWSEVKDRLHSSAFALSGGQQQRLCIARALAVEPEILLLDEPASALDPIATSKIEELIHELKKKYTIIIVTHNMQQAARVSDYTAFFMLGELVEFDQTSKIFTNPANKITEDYVTGRFG
ncbi:MAG: phosphate ABC transporter ATP-binding protein [Candidatus Omnitrophica bacterium]|nr:phosphate ABC transporter ATP-binding protein [Candidatus Omnitrophota bacterium]